MFKLQTSFKPLLLGEGGGGLNLLVEVTVNSKVENSEDVPITARIWPQDSYSRIHEQTILRVLRLEVSVNHRKGNMVFCQVSSFLLYGVQS
jgi:hypothetical protein